MGKRHPPSADRHETRLAQGRRMAGLTVAVTVGGHRCGLPADVVDEVHRAVEVTAVPLAPEVVEGVVDLRGEVVPVIGLRRRLGLPPREVRPSDRLVFIRLPGRRVALRVDAVLDLVTVHPTQQTAGAGLLPDAGYLDGVVRLDDGLLLIHDVAAFLSSEEAASLDDALAQRRTG